MSKKFTYEEVKYFIEIESNSGCKLLTTEYINNHTKLKLQCKCGNNFEVNFSKFKNNKRQCSKCGYQNLANDKKLSYEYVKNFIEFESDSGCKLLSNDYKDINSKLEMQCNCGEIFFASFAKFKDRNKRHCKSCSTKIKRELWVFDYEYVKKYIEVESNSGCKLLSDTYINAQSELEIQCKCGNVFRTTFNCFKNKNPPQQQCPNCGRSKPHINLRYSYEYVKNFIENNTNCSLISTEYAGINDNLDFLCECGNKFTSTFHNLTVMKTAQCKDCFRKSLSHSYEYVKNYIENEVGGFKLLSKEYINSASTLTLKCENDHIIYTSLNNFQHNKSCSKCRELTRGEEKVKEYLIKNNVKFEIQHTFDGLIGVGGRLLKYDFVIFNRDNNIKLLIEYDGEQHFRPVNFGGMSDKKAKLNYIKTKIHDKRKNEYCKNNDISLLRIPYWDYDNIEKILEIKLTR